MPTKADFDTEMVSRATVALLTQFGMSVLVDGTNPDTVGPLRWAYRILGLTPITGINVTDADLALVSFNQFLDLCDLGEYRLLSNVLSSMTKSRIQIGVNSIYYSDQRDALLRRLILMKATIDKKFNLNVVSLTGATITLNNSEEDDGTLTADEQGGW